MISCFRQFSRTISFMEHSAGVAAWEEEHDSEKGEQWDIVISAHRYQK